MRAPALAALLSTLPAALPAVPAPHSWATVPLFFHSTNASGLFNAAALARMRAFAVITLDKSQGLANRSDARSAELRALDAARAIRAAVGANATLLFYQNSLIDWPQYATTHAALVADPALRLQNASGQDALGVGGTWLFNMPLPAARAVPADLCAAMAGADAGATFDGCFLDRGGELNNFGPEARLTLAQKAAADAGHDAMLAALVARLARGGKAALLNNNGNFSLAAPGLLGMVEDFGANETCIIALRDFAAAGRAVEAHAGYFPDGSDAQCAAAPVNSLAAFLIGAAGGGGGGGGAYYACAPGWSSDPGWPAARDPWLDAWPQYARPLGAPLADAVRSAAGVWTRRFASGTNVTFDAAAGSGRIAWADGAVDAGANAQGSPKACAKWAVQRGGAPLM